MATSDRIQQSCPSGRTSPPGRTKGKYAAKDSGCESVVERRRDGRLEEGGKGDDDHFADALHFHLVSVSFDF